MIVHVVIIKETDTVELFTDLRAMTERYKVLQEEGVEVAITSSEL